jgi:pimeloyl-ACP methyl ester carboxylesterase
MSTALTEQLAPGVTERFVSVNGDDCRVWEKGSGEPVGVLAGVLGTPRWTPFLDRLAAERRVVVPSLPGFPGAGLGYEQLDSIVDWVAATLDLLDGAGLDGADLVGCCIGGALAAEVTALSPHTVKRLVLVGAYGLYDDDRPPANLWAMRSTQAYPLMSVDPERVKAQVVVPEGGDEVEWPIEMQRAIVAGARLFWPLCDVGLGKRLHRIKAPTLVAWGEDDGALPPSYAQRFAAGVSGPVEVAMLAGAAHLVDLDAPEQLADRVLSFLS